jgi:hypothetical protein
MKKQGNGVLLSRIKFKNIRDIRVPLSVAAVGLQKICSRAGNGIAETAHVSFYRTCLCFSRICLSPA